MEKRSVWNQAAVPGLVLGGVSIAYELSGLAVGFIKMPLLSGAIGLLLWIAKFVGCILLLKAFMKKYAANNSNATHADIIRFGLVTTLLSAIVYSGLYLAYTIYIVPDVLDQSVDMVTSLYSNKMSAKDIGQIENLKADLPKYICVFNFLRCLFFGVLFSTILSRSIVSSNPFKDNESIDNNTSAE